MTERRSLWSCIPIWRARSRGRGTRGCSANILPRWAAGGGVAAVFICAGSIAAQPPSTSLTADRERLAELVGDTTLATPRAPRQLAVLRGVLPETTGSGAPVYLVGPELRVTWNSNLPYSMNDGAMWAGRGLSFSMTGGAGLEASAGRGVRIRLVVAPTVTYSQNAPFQIFPVERPGWSAYANPFHGPESSMDLPHRYGDRHLLFVHPGRSAVSVAWPRVEVGVTARNEWWGPGLRNGLLMSDNAPGIPRLFVRTATPVNTPLGQVDGELLSGTLTQSFFFRSDVSANRTLSGVLLQLRPACDTALTFGFARVVYAPIGPEASPFTMTLARTFDAIARWENLSGTGDQRSDQISSVFARWMFPSAGLEVYGEWARMDLPRNVGELLTAPHHTGAWTFGLQYLRPDGDGSKQWTRVQSEVTYLEQSRVLADRLTPDFYTGQASPQGYTQRGQLIGAAIGPGSSSQFVAVDRLHHTWQAGVFVGRIRWDNDAMYRQQDVGYFSHDVSLLGGFRGGWRTADIDLSAELSLANRYNYLFQNGSGRPGGFRTVDVANVTFALTATPR